MWRAEPGNVIGLDLEGYEPRNLADCGADLIAALLTYDPSDTPAKRRAAEALALALDVPPAAVEFARGMLAGRRKGKISHPVSGIILAGGKSSRMGACKSDLLLYGKSFLHRQVEKLRALGIKDIILSGAACPELPETRRIGDKYSNRGPLGGLHACLSAARHTQALVVTVDTPLIPLSALAHLLQAHRQGITILRHGKKIEPLIAVYDSTIAQDIEPLLREGSAPVLRLLDQVPWQRFDYVGPEEFFLNCNTPGDFAQLQSLMADYQKHGLSL